MRAVVVHPGPQFSVHDVYIGWCDALAELGCTVVRYNLDERLTFYAAASTEGRSLCTAEQAIELAVNGIYATLYKAQPDVLVVISGFYIPQTLLEVVRRRGTQVVLIHTESPYEDVRQLTLAPYANINLINDPRHIDLFRAVAPTWYVPHAYRPERHRPGPAVPRLECDLGFVGTGYPSRVDFFEALDLTGLDVVLAGNWQLLADDSPLARHVGHPLDECCDNDEAVSLYRSARCGINTYRREAYADDQIEGWSIGPREVEMAACGLYFVREPRPEGDDLFPMLPTFTTPDEASAVIRWALSDDDRRTTAAVAARAAVADRTFVHNARSLLRLLSER